MKKSYGKLTALILMAMSTASHAFLTDNSNQKTIMIGRGGAENMTQMRVTNVQSTQRPVTQNSYQETGAVRQERSTTVIPSGAQATYASQQVQYNQSAPQAYSTQYNNNAQYPNSSQYTNSYGTNNAFDQLAITTNSAAVIVFDPQTGQSLYEKNVDARRSIASISKVMTAMVLLDAGLDMRDEIVLIESDLHGAKQAGTNLKAGDRLNRSEFMLMMLMKSENPAAKALARTYPGGYDAFIAAMNQKAQSLGMYSTSFSDSSGLNPQNMSSAKDLARMMQVVGSDPRYQTIRNFSTARNYDFYINNYNYGSRVFKAANTSSLVRSGSYPITASKTGFIREAGHCVVMETYVNGRPAIIVLLGANGSANRWNDAESILTQLAYRR